MADHTVKRRGTDSSGRGIYASDYMWAWWLRCVELLGFTPTVVQGAWMTMAGGGAGASAGYHDGGGCFDLRLWDRTAAERTTMIHVFRSMGAAYWERYESQGFDLHAHLCLGSDHDIDSGAFAQWREYLAGGDGLTGSARDYHWRPNPLVTKPPPEDDMANYADQLNEIQATQKQTLKELREFRSSKAEGDKKIRQALAKLRLEVKDDATKSQVDAVIALLDEDAPE